MFLKKQSQRPGNKFYRFDTSHAASESRRRQVYDYYREPPAQRTLSRLMLILIFIAFLIIGQSIFQIPWLVLRHVNWENMPDIPREQLDQRLQPILQKNRFLIFKNNNYWLFKPYSLQEELADEFWLKNVSIKKKFPSTLTISGEERILPFVRQTPEKFIQLDLRGQEIGELASVAPGARIVADERSDRSQGISRDYLEQISTIVKKWSFPASVISLNKFHLTDDPRQITLSTSRGYNLLFSAEEDLPTQIQRLKELLDQNEIPANIQYIDFLFGVHFYFN